MTVAAGPSRRPLLLSLLASARGIGPEAAQAREAPGLQEETGLPDLLQALLPSVVNIAILKRQPPSAGHPQQQQGTIEPLHEVGSGFIVAPEGVIATNRHVVEGAYRITVTGADGGSYQGRVLAVNHEPDLALVQIEPAAPLQAVRFADVESLRVGEMVIAVGNPLGLTTSVSVGVVSALNRDLRTSVFDHYIQTDAAINHGNSGGPLFNMRGEVVGMNSVLVQPEAEGGSIGLGLAIPADTVSFIVQHLLRYGRLRPGWIGVEAQPVTEEIAEASGRKGAGFVIVTHIQPESPAEGVLRPGDIVLALNGTPVRDFRALARGIARTVPGTLVMLTTWRDRQRVEFDVIVADWPLGPGNPAGLWQPPNRGPRVSGPALGMQLATVGPDLVKRLSLPADQPGVAVVSVATNSPGADAGFQRGDIITRFQQTPVLSLEGLKVAVQEALRAKQSDVLVLVRRKDGFRWLAVPTDAK